MKTGGTGVVVAESIPLLGDFNKETGGAKRHIIRTGTVWTASAHIITAVIGSGVLSLAWSMAQLGWIAGPLAILFFAGITFVQSTLLADCYRSPDPEHGHIRNQSYLEAVKLNLDQRSVWVCALFQHVGLYGAGIAYIITAATSLQYATTHRSAIQKSNYYHREGRDTNCSYGVDFYMLIFGAVQILLSQIPDFHDIEWLSVMAAIMSFSYSFIGFGLGVAKVIANGKIKGGPGGIPAGSATQKMWKVSQGLGDIAFAFPYSILLLEIQNTLKSPPAENKTMKKASMISILITTFFYLCCGCFGYAAFGDDTPGNLLSGFGFYEPLWLVDFANICIVLHLVGGYQMYCQPIYAFVDRWLAEKFPDSGFVNNHYAIKLPLLPKFRLNLLRLCYRTLYVASTTGIAMLFPYFNQVLGVLGALNFWPLAIYFPVEMYFVQKKIGAWTRKWVVLQAFSYVCLLVSMFALVGSLEGIFSQKLE